LEPLVSGLVTIVDSTTKYLPLTLRTDDLLPYSQVLFTAIGAIAVALFASRMAARAAIGWGSMVKGAMGVFLLLCMSASDSFPRPIEVRSKNIGTLPTRSRIISRKRCPLGDGSHSLLSTAILSPTSS
jgi:hypothetical protein